MSDYDSGYDPKYGYNRNAFAHKTIGTAIAGRIVKLIVTPIGLTSEAIHHHRDKKKRSGSQPDVQAAATTPTTAENLGQDAASPSEDQAGEIYVNVQSTQAEELIASGQAVPADNETATHELIHEDAEDDGIERDEADWALDDAASEREGDAPPPYTARPAGGSNSKKTTSYKLPFPVILPQRRPGTKARGFIRAYAPVLQDSSIDQDTFLNFLKDFHKAAQASPVFEVIMIASAIAGLYPDMLVGLGTQAVLIAAAVGQEIQERWRTNKFLDQANKDLFIPQGLFALIVTYKPGDSEQAEISTEKIDLGASAMAKYGDTLITSEKISSAEEEEQGKPKKMDEIREKMKRLRIASGETHEAEIPVTCAPLTFPALDVVVAASTAKGGNSEGLADSIKARSKSTSKFVNDYFDRRAQATYAFNNPNSALTSQMAPAAPQFQSRFADPNNATNTHLFSLITGGKYKAQPLGARRRYERAQRKAEEKRRQGIRAKSSNRMLQEGVLYLMIVNMPTEQELEKARKGIQEAKERKAAAKKAGKARS
ncbi:hypothetical protein P7C71_g1035, partial [Lecanoromycetidae sp. Uapishka_2]